MSSFLDSEDLRAMRVRILLDTPADIVHSYKDEGEINSDPLFWNCKSLLYISDKHIGGDLISNTYQEFIDGKGKIYDFDTIKGIMTEVVKGVNYGLAKDLLEKSGIPDEEKAVLRGWMKVKRNKYDQ